MGHYATGMLLLGIGWNFAFVAATTAVADKLPPAVASRVQALNDVIVFMCSGTASLCSGPALNSWGWVRLQDVACAFPAAIAVVLAVAEAAELTITARNVKIIIGLFNRA